MPHYDMDVLTAATVFYKCAQIASTTPAGTASTGNTGNVGATDAKSQLVTLSNMLANPRPIENPDATNIRTAYMSTLQQEVLKMEEQDPYPISRPESKAAVKSLYNQVKLFHEHLTKPTDQTLQLSTDQQKTKVNGLISDFQLVVNGWGEYSTRYLGPPLIDQMQLDKSKADPTAQQDFQNRILFWQEITRRINETITQIPKMLKDMLVGNPNNPLMSTPFQSAPV